jgi:hypothetical protein
MDVRPRFIEDYRVKFKAEALPLKNEIGGFRILYSHNAEFPLSRVHEADRSSLTTITKVFPVLECLKASEGDKVELVNATAVDEVLLDLGTLDFGKGVSGKANVAVWRTHGDQKQLVGVRLPVQIQTPRRIPRQRGSARCCMRSQHCFLDCRPKACARRANAIIF